MEKTAWDTALAPHPAGCCKDRAAARPDPCDGRGVGHFLRGPAGFGAIGTGPAGGGLDLYAGIKCPSLGGDKRCFIGDS